MIAIAAGVRRSSTLRVLNMTGEGAHAVPLAPHDATPDNLCDDFGAAHFGDALRDNTSLVWLALGRKAAVRWVMGEQFASRKPHRGARRHKARCGDATEPVARSA